MSSEISTKHPMTPQAGYSGPADAGAAFRPWHFFVLGSLVAATAAVLMAPRPTPEHLVLISATLMAAGLVAAAFHRMLLPLVGAEGDVAAEPLGRRSRAALEREKTLILRSIKELEFDRAMGKVAEEDFNEMAGRLRSRALTIMKQLDAGTSYREMIERDLAVRMGSASPSPGNTAEAAAVPEARSLNPEARSLKPEALHGVPCACGTTNDPDARFCKSCGAKLETV